MKQDKRRIAAYVRVSSDQQAEDMTIEIQIEKLKSVLTAMGILNGTNALYEFVPCDPTAHSIDNPSFFVDNGYNFEEFKEDTAFHHLQENFIKAGRVDSVMVFSLNRLFRSEYLEVLGKTLDIFRKNEVTVFFDGSERPADIVLTLLAAMSSQVKTEDLTKMHLGKLRVCKASGAPPSGQVKLGFHWHKETKKRYWEPIEDELKVVRWIGCLSAGIADYNLPDALRTALDQKTLGLSDKEICELLNINGINLRTYILRKDNDKLLKSNPEGKIHADWITRILIDPTYNGRMTFRFRDPKDIRRKKIKKERTEIVHELDYKVFNDDEWAQIQERRKLRSCYARRNVKKDYLLKDMIICTECGRPFRCSASRKNGKEVGSYYSCNRKKSSVDDGRCASRKSLNAPVIEKQVWEEVLNYLMAPDMAQSLTREDNSLLIEVIDRLEKSILPLEQRLADFDNKVYRLNTLIVDGVLSPAEGKSQKKRLEVECAEIKKKIKSIKLEVCSKKSILQTEKSIDLKSLLEKIQTRLGQLTFEEKKSIISQVIKSISCDKDKKVQITFYRAQ